MRTIFVDADACPVTAQTVQAAREFHLPAMLLCDTNHVLESDYAEVTVIGAGRDAVDLALVNRCKKGDVVVTQDYGLAALAMTKGAYPIHQSGMRYTKDNIDALLNERYLAGKARRASAKTHLKGPRKRTPADDERFLASLRALLKELETA
jgi:uncharacterized protein YaiI (UPF0178 family)